MKKNITLLNLRFKLSLIISFVFAIQNISFSQTNIDFEAATSPVTGWTGLIGANMNSNVSFTACSTAVNPATNGTNLSMIPKSYFSMMTTGTDPYGGFTLTSPLGGNNVLRLGNENTNVNEGGDCTTPKNCSGTGPAYCSTICGTPVGSSYIESPAEAVTQTFAVTSANALLTYAWAAVLNDGGHPVGEEPYVEVKIYNQSGVELTCYTSRVVQKTGVTSTGWTKSGTKNCWYPTSPASDVYYKSWTTVTVPLFSYIGQNVTVRFAVAGCVDGGHFGYAYFDAKTAPATITPSNASPCSGQSITLSAPSGVSGPYSWSGPGVVSGASTATVTVNAAGTYTLSVGTGTCVATMTTAVTYGGGPTVTASAGSPTICNGGGPVILTGSGATTYTWSANAGSVTTSTASVNPSSTTVYTVTGATSGCTGTQTVQVTVTPTPTLSVSGTTTLCNGQSTVLTAGTSAGTYTWSANAGGGSASTVTVTPGLGTTTYTLSGDNSGCPGSKTISVTVNPNPTVTVSGSNTVCSGNPVVLSGSTTAGTFTWSANAGGGSAASATVSPTGTTTYTLSGSNGTCTASTTITLTVTPTPTLAVNSPTICSGQSATLTAATATSYSWSTSATTNTISVNPSSTTVYTVTGSNGTCTTTKTATVTVNTTPTVSISGTNTVCSGNPVILTGGTATTYTWSTSATTSTISVSPTSNTTYTLTGANGACTATAAITITVTPTPTLTVNSPSICSGQSAVLTAATANSYSWSTSATTNTISVNPTTTTVYTVTGDNGSGCTVTKTATVNVTATPTLNISGASPICSGTTLVLTGGTATNYTWLPGGVNTSTISITPPAGTNTYTLQGANGTCTASTVAFVDVSPTPTINITGASPICSGQNIVLTGGTASTYTWSANAGAGIHTNTVSVSPTTTTTYTLAGSSGLCTSSATVSVTVNPTPTLSIGTSSYTICNGDNTPISASGATTYTWTTGGGLSCTVCATPTANPASTTIYTVTGTTGSCVSAPGTVTVNVNPLPNITAVPSSSTICSSTSTTITANGGNTYTWSPAGSLNSANGSPVTATPTASTTYTLTGTDNNGCQNTNTVSVTVAPTPTMNISAVPNAICSGQSVVLNGGTATTYTWSSNAGGATTATATITPTATDTYTLTGAIGSCTAEATVTVPVNPLPQIGSNTVSPAPCGQSTGCIDTVLVTGGTPNYQYSWNGGPFSGSVKFCNQPAGTYSLVVQDANGCQSTQNISIPNLNGPSAPQVAATPTVACLGDSISMGINSPQTGIVYTWTDNTGTHTGTTYTVNNIGPGGSYNIVVHATDTNGCVSAATPITILVHDIPATAVSGVTHFCKNDQTVLNAAPTGGNYSYQWTQNGTPVNGANSASYTVTAAGNYGVVVQDNNTGCRAASLGNYTVTIDSLPTIDTTNMVVTTSNCNQSTGSVTNVTVTPNAGNNTYTWTDGGGNVVGTGINLGNVPAGSYCLLVVDSNNCKTTVCGVQVKNANAPVVVANASAGSICSGQSSVLTASGATTYTWMPGSIVSNTISVTPNSTSSYTVTGDSLGCTAQQQVTVNVTTTPTVSAVSTASVICSTQSATLTASGATSYSWTPGGAGGSITVNPTGNTTYTVVGMNGNCSDTTTIALGVTPTPTLSVAATGTAVCAGQTATLTASGATNYTWMPSGTSNDTLTDTPQNTTTYTVTGDNAGCTTTQQITVVVNQLPILTTVGNQTVCSGAQVNPINYSSGGASVNWTNTNGNVGIATSGTGNINGYTAPNVTTQETGVITATPVDNGTGCQGIAQSYTVIINPAPQAAGGTADSALCGNANGGVTGINVTGGTPNYTYQWYDNGVLMPGETNPTLSNVGMGTYNIVITDANGCTVPAGTTSYTVNGSPAVVASITPPVSQGQAPLNVTFTNNTTGATFYAWNFGNGDVSAQQTPPAITYTAPGTYTVVMFANNGGCMDTATAIVIIDAATSIVIPNIYSPNGDGINDEWFITCVGIRDLHADIFNRWGQLVYQLQGINDVWNGVMNNGNHASEGTYYYILDATGYDGKTYKSHGSLTLVK